jgi:hypothetical protein
LVFRTVVVALVGSPFTAHFGVWRATSLLAMYVVIEVTTYFVGLSQRYFADDEAEGWRR